MFLRDQIAFKFAPIAPKFVESVIFTPHQYKRFSMKHAFSFVAAVMLASAAWAQTTVTLTVDMSNEMVSPDGVHVAGNFKAGTRDPLTDNGDGTWSYTFTSDTAAATNTNLSMATPGAPTKAFLRCVLLVAIDSLRLMAWQAKSRQQFATTAVWRVAMNRH